MSEYGKICRMRTFPRLIAVLIAVFFIFASTVCLTVIFAEAVSAETVLTLVYEREGVTVSEIPFVREGTVLSSGLEDETVGTGYYVEWYFDEEFTRPVVYPYTVELSGSSDGRIYFYGKKERKTETITVKAADKTATFSVLYGEIPVLPDSVFGYTVDKWFTDPDFTEEYVLSPLEENITLYPLFTDYFVTVNVDGESVSVLYGQTLIEKTDTDTHRFVGFVDSEGVASGKITAEGEYFSVYERVYYRITVSDGTERNIYVEVGGFLTSDKVTDGKVFRYADGTEVAFPVFPEDDITIYAEEEPEENPEEIPLPTEYSITVECAYAEYDCEESYKAGDIVEIIFDGIKDGYSIKYVLASADGRAVVTDFTGSKLTFVMPEADVTVKVVFESDLKDDATTVPSEKEPFMTTREIIAVSITGGVALVAGGIALFGFIRKKKRSKGE